MKVHIHTNNRASIFALCRTHGEIQDEKADDMIQQQRAINRILVSHCDNEAAAKELKYHIEKFIPRIESIALSQTGATLGAHGGPEIFGLALQPQLE